MGVPGIFCCQYTDGIWWIPLKRIDASRHHVGGCFRIVESINDIEPLIDVPIADMTRVKEPPPVTLEETFG
jgi:hypothetical protein